MKKNFISKKIIFSTLFILLIHFAAFSQTFIRYNTWAGASGCNIFSDPNNASTVINVPCTVNGTNTTIPHLTAVGQPTYDNTNKTVNLVSEIKNGSQNQGSEYRITVNFKQGYSYKITITAARIMSQQTGANVLLRTDLNSGGSGSNNQCNGTGVIDANGSGNLKKSLAVTNSTFANADTNYVYDYLSLSQPQAYLMIAAIPPAASVYQTVLIRRIKIEETPPAVSFSISSSISSMSCGATAPVTFTINNNSNTSGITGYTWNIGATPNGWIYNGNPAPATIPITSTSLSPLILTPDCGKTLSSISATVTANGNNYNTNTASVSTTVPDLSINGPLVVCSGSANYTISNLPCNATVANWTITSSSNAASLTVNGNTATLTKLTDGSAILAVDVTACGITRHLTKEIQFGAPRQVYTINESTNPQCYQLGFVYLFYFTPGSYDNQLIDETIWSYQPYDPYYPYPNPATETIVTTPNTFSEHAEIIFQQWGTWQLFVRLKNSCGTGPDPSSKIIEISPYGCGWSFLTTPNPATSSIEIALNETTQQSNLSMSIKEIIITDKMGTTVKQLKNGGGVKRQVINISHLKQGLYYIRVFNGREWKSKSIIKQ